MGAKVLMLSLTVSDSFKRGTRGVKSCFDPFPLAVVDLFSGVSI